MNCKITQSKLLEYMDGALYQGERQDVELHLCGCGRCRDAYHEMKSFSDTCAEFVVYPDKPYSFNALRARMATLRPIDEIVAFFPKMRSRGLVARFAMSLLLIAFAGVLPASVRGTRDACVAARRPFTEEKVKWEESDQYQQELDRQYRQQMAEHHRIA